MPMALDLFQQLKIFFPADVCGSQVILDNKDRNFRPIGDYNRSDHTGLCIYVMVALYPYTFKACFFKNLPELVRRDRNYFWHVLYACQFGCDKFRRQPFTVSIFHIVRFFKNTFEGSHFIGFFKKKPNSGLEHLFGVFNALTTARYIEFRAVGNKCLIFLKNNNVKIDLYHNTPSRYDAATPAPLLYPERPVTCLISRSVSFSYDITPAFFFGTHPCLCGLQRAQPFDLLSL
jgi:hypothetical protein